MPPFQSKSFGDVFITFRSPKVLPTSTQPVVECSYFRRPARVHHIQNTACGFSLHLEIGYTASVCFKEDNDEQLSTWVYSGCLAKFQFSCGSWSKRFSLSWTKRAWWGNYTTSTTFTPTRASQSSCALATSSTILSQETFHRTSTSTKLYNSGQSLWFSQSGS